MKKKPTWLDKKVTDIESWGPLLLFQHLKNKWDAEMTRQRNTIFSMGAENYKGSNLETHDRYVNAVKLAFDREFKKIYDEKERTSQPTR